MDRPRRVAGRMAKADRMGPAWPGRADVVRIGEEVGICSRYLTRLWVWIQSKAVGETMPAPEPDTLWFEEYDGQVVANFQRYFWTGNVAHRKARAIAIMRRMRRGDWLCLWCGETLPDYKRADARYCCEGCRKSAARGRRAIGKGQRSG